EPLRCGVGSLTEPQKEEGSGVMKSEELKCLERIERHLRRIADKLAGPEEKPVRKSEGAVIAGTRGPHGGDGSEESDLPTRKSPAERAQRGTPSTREPVPGRSGMPR